MVVRLNLIRSIVTQIPKCVVKGKKLSVMPSFTNRNFLHMDIYYAKYD